VAIHNSDRFPPAVIFGVPESLNRLQIGLWEKLQACLVEFGETTEGQELTSYWRIQGFFVPDAAFSKEVSEVVKKYPPRWDAVD
jgi:hypothetical protein